MIEAEGGSPGRKLVEVLQCGCNPGKAYASRSSFRNHFSSNRHRAWEQDKKTEEKAGTAVDILTRRLEAFRIENRSLAHRVKELESALFATARKRAVSDTLKRKVAAKQGWKCEGCSDLLSYVYEVDHVKPLFAGGENSEGNLQALCRECHGKKTADDRQKFRGERP